MAFGPMVWYSACLREEMAQRVFPCGELSSKVVSTQGREAPRRLGVKASGEWLAATGARFSPGTGRSGCAHLKSYSANYREWGDGPPIILVPGLAGGYELLGPLARLLAADHRVISYQLRGEDDCFALRHRFGLADLVEDLGQFLDWHCLERPALLGVSFGGALALQFAARYPHRIRALAVQGVGARFERSLLKQVAGVVLSRYPLPADSPFVNQFFNLLFGCRQEPGPLFQFVTRQCWQTDQSVMAHRFRLVERFNMLPCLDRVRVPAVVLAGDKDLLVSERSLRELSRGVPCGRQVRISGAGHLAFVTHPRRVADAVRSFLASGGG
jgi:pimeloyl-ACP methyl ester carboxylesterase